MTLLSEEQFEKYTNDLIRQLGSDIIWLKERICSTEEINDFHGVENLVFKECEKILKQYGLIKVYSINIVKSYIRKNGKLRIFRPGPTGSKSDYDNIQTRYYDPLNEIMYTYINAIEIARYNLSRDRQELVGMSKLMTESLYESNVTLTESDVVSFMYCGGKEKKDTNLKYLGKIEYDNFTNNKRSHTAKWIKKARNI